MSSFHKQVIEKEWIEYLEKSKYEAYIPWTYSCVNRVGSYWLQLLFSCFFFLTKDILQLISKINFVQNMKIIKIVFFSFNNFFSYCSKTKYLTCLTNLSITCAVLNVVGYFQLKWTTGISIPYSFAKYPALHFIFC